MLEFTGEYSSEAFVSKVTEITGYKWSRTTLAQLLEYGVVTHYTDTAKPGSKRQRLMFGKEAFREVELFMLTKSALPFMSRGKNPKEIDANSGKDTLKFRLAKHACNFLNDWFSVKNEPSMAKLQETVDKELDEYLMQSEYIGAKVTDDDGILDENSYKELKKKLREVIFCYYFFTNLIDGNYARSESSITDDWDYLNGNILPAQGYTHPKVSSNAMLQGCYWLSYNIKELSDSIVTFCRIIGRTELKNGKKYDYSDKQRDDLITCSKIAVYFDTEKHFLSSICCDTMIKLGIHDLKDINPVSFPMVAQIVFLSAVNQSKYMNPVLTKREKFTIK